MEPVETIAREIGKRPPGVIEDTAPNDPLFRPDNAEHYFASADSALRQIRLALLAAGRSSVLDPSHADIVKRAPCGCPQSGAS